MTPWLQDADVTLYHGDVLPVLRELPSESVDCVVTSPPYWGLRDYGEEGQIGLEATPDEYVAELVTVFRYVMRVLAPHGTCWVNLGDSYANQGFRSDIANNGGFTGRQQRENPGYRPSPPKEIPPGLKPKDLVGIPWRVAFALQADGWWLRSDIIWAKPNPMPESVTDRPTKSHEYVFLLTKQPRYFFDQEAVREAYQPSTFERDAYGYNHAFANQFKGSPTDQRHPDGKQLPPGSFAKGPDGRKTTRVLGQDGSEQHRDGERWPNPTGRNVRTVWTVATQPYPEAHFATYPEELVRRCVLAGSPERVCVTCGEPSVRIVDKPQPPAEMRERRPQKMEYHTRAVAGGGGKIAAWYADNPGSTVGWSDCGHNTWRPGTVLDPFVGSGTTCKVARDHGRHSIGIDLSQEYLALAARRLQQQSLFSEVT